MEEATEQDDRSAKFIIRLARALHVYGAPANRLEAALAAAAARFGLEGQFFSTPTSIFIAIGPTGEQKMVLERVEPAVANLEKLSELDRLLEEVAVTGVSAEDGERRLAEIEGRPDRYGWVQTMLAYILVAASAAVILGGALWDVLAAAGAGTFVGIFSFWVARFSSESRLFELTAAFGATLFASVISEFVAPVSILLVAASALIVLVPGLSLTVAINELSTQHLVSGSSRLAASLIAFVTLAFGLGLGLQVGNALFGVAETAESVKLPFFAFAIALLFAAWALMVFFRAHPRDYPWVLAAGAVALLSGRFGVQFLGLEVGTMVSALLVGLSANLFSRTRKRPVSLFQLPGMILLVPGAIGFRSASALVREDTVVGVQTAFSVILIAVALVTGLVIANAVLPARRSL